MAAVEHVAHEVEHPAERLRTNRLGLWLFIASESFLFAALISARFYLLGTERAEHLNQLLGFAITNVLLASSLFAYRAEAAARFGDQRGFRRATATTIGLGLLFMVGVVLEFREGLEFFPPGTLYGSAFFTLVGFHAFHVFTGIVALAALLWTGRDGRFGPDNHWPVEGVVKYWHFVDVAWVFIFPTLYLVK
jgi:cytochrome c oxidase subunit 3